MFSVLLGSEVYHYATGSLTETLDVQAAAPTGTLPISDLPKVNLGSRAKRMAYLGPGSSPPPPRAELTVAGPSAFRTVVIAVFGVHGTSGVVV